MTYFIMIRGPLGVGKSTIAKSINKELRGEYLSMDHIVDKNRVVKRSAKDGMIDVRNFLSANKVIIPIVKKLISEGKHVITDGCFYCMEQIVNLVDKIGEDKVLVFDLKAPLEECIERDKGRKNSLGPDATRAVYNAVSKFNFGIRINTYGKTPDQTTKEILKHIKI